MSYKINVAVHSLLVLLLLPLSVCAQKFPSVNIVSPSATALEKFVDFPTSMHTGVPDISIPIYTVTEGTLQLPVTLSYHASGLQVGEVASWVGAGWSLNAGGVVSRSVKGLPDESVDFDGDSFFSDGGYSSYFFFPGTAGEGTRYRKFAQGSKDSEPDLFTFSLPGYGGKFAFREDLTPVLFPEGDVKIETILKPGENTKSVSDYIQGFKITTPDGTKYYFGVTPQTDDVDPIEKSQVYTVNGGLSWSDVISSWHLYKIESADNQFDITLSYRAENFGYVTLSGNACLSDGCSELSASKLIMHGVAVQKINFTAGSIDFIATTDRLDLGNDQTNYWDNVNSSAKRLDEIRINSTQGAYCASFKFDYGYFVNTSQVPLVYELTQYQDAVGFTTDRKRLKLNSITESSCNSIVKKPPYSFTYYDEGSVPRRLTLAQDHWGFYNGKDENTTLVPSHENGFISVAGADRDPSWPAMQAGTLSSIQYPTGGRTLYTYEPNTAVVATNCGFADESLIYNVQAGMSNENSETVFYPDLTPSTRMAFVFELQAYGQGEGSGSGTIYLDGEPIAFAANQGTTKVTRILNPGTYSVSVSAGSDGGGGRGVVGSVSEGIYSCAATTSKQVGGLRTQKITKSGGSGSPDVTHWYAYDQGTLYSIPTYVLKMKHELLIGNASITSTMEGCVAFTPTDPSLRTFRSPVSTQPLQNVQGYHIGYKKVKETQADGGYTVYRYEGGNFDLPGGWIDLPEDVCVRRVDNEVCLPTDPKWPMAPPQFDFTRGKLRSVETFDKKNNKLKEVTTTEEYEKTNVGIFGVAAAIWGFGSSDGQALATHYELKSARLIKTTQVEKVFDGGKVFQTETSTFFDSDKHNMPTQKEVSSSNTVQNSKFLYVPDLTNCKVKVDASACATTYLVEANNLHIQYLANLADCKANICEESTFLPEIANQFPCGYDISELDNTKICMTARWKDYNYRLNFARQEYIGCINALDKGEQCITNGINNNADLGVKSLYLLEKQNRLELIESPSWDANVFQNSVYYDYKSDPANGGNVYLQNVYRADPNGSSFATASIQTGEIRRDSKYRTNPLYRYVYENGQPVEITDGGGITTSYIWGFDNTFPVVKGVGTAYGALKTSYQSNPANIQQDPNLANAQITVYNYGPMGQIISTTDANGQVLHYEYDELNRLIYIRDHQQNIVKAFEYGYRK